MDFSHSILSNLIIFAAQIPTGGVRNFRVVWLNFRPGICGTLIDFYLDCNMQNCIFCEADLDEADREAKRQAFRDKQSKTRRAELDRENARISSKRHFRSF